MEEEEQEMTGKNKTALNERLIVCVKKNEYEEVERCLKRKADVNYEGKSEIMKKIIRKNGLLLYGPAAQG